MNRHSTACATALFVLATFLPSIASAQLTARERDRAEAIARIQAREQAKADAEQRSKERWMRHDMAKAACTSRLDRRWDSANQICKPSR